MYKGYIYRHWVINDKGVEKNYIGQVYNRTPKQRWGINGKGYTSQKREDGQLSYFGKAIIKYGWDNFTHEVLEVIECETLEELVLTLDKLEIHYIEKYDSFYNGYNETTGGKNGYIVSETTKKRQSNSHKAFYSSEAGMKQKEEQSRKMKGEGNPFYGEKHTEETRKELRKLAKQRTGAKSNRGKKTICLQTKQVFDTAKQASEWCHGNVKKHCQSNSSYAGTHPETGERLVWAYYEDYVNMTQDEINKKILQAKEFGFDGNKNPRARAVICLETKQVFGTSEEAKEWCHGNVNQNLRGLSKSAGKHPETGEKLHWMYYEDYLEQQNKDKSDSKIA